MQIHGHFPRAVLHEYIVMPNHVHGIIELTGETVVGDVVGVENLQPLQHPQQRNEFQKMIPRSIGSIVKGYKIGVTNGAGIIPIFKWYGNAIITNTSFETKNPIIALLNISPTILQNGITTNFINNRHMPFG